MTDRTSDGDKATPKTGDPATDSDTPSRGSGHTGAGQEATKGTAPAQHDDEHQSEYGGGGANGGKK